MNQDAVLPNCLLVDDLEENLIALKALLRDEKINLLTARSGAEALELLLTHEFALSIIDVQMPGMDGFELAEIMRSTEKTKPIPIVFVTATGTSAQRVFQGYEAGAIDFLQKPLDGRIVISKVRIFMELFSQKVQLQQKLKKIKETEVSLQKALKSRDEFLSICSHELNTPLTSLKMQIQLIRHRNKKLSDEQVFSIENMKAFVNHVERGVEKVIHLVNDMLDISRITNGKLSLEMGDVDCVELINEVLLNLDPILTTAKNKVEVVIEDRPVGYWDKFRIEQVVTNILINASKYAPGAKIFIGLKKEDKFAVLVIRDEGPGISIEDQKRIFERYERIENGNLRGGLGLGLYISKEIIETHRGSISLMSTEGEGSTFSIKLPLS